MVIQNLISGSKPIVAGFCIIIFCCDFIQADESKNCSIYNGTRPYIWHLGNVTALYLLKSDVRSMSVNNDLSFNAFIGKQFYCSHDRPVRWVFHLDPAVNQMTISVDFFERVAKRSFNTTNYTYTTNFRLWYFSSDLKYDSLLSCEPVPLLHECERNFVQIWKNQVEPKPTETPHSALSQALLKSSTEDGNYQSRFTTWNDCPLRLHFKVEVGNVIYFKWIGSVDEEVALTNETTFFENVFRLHGTSEKHCVKVLDATETCVNCQLAEEVTNYTINAIALTAKQVNVTLVYKGIFSVPKGSRDERLFYFDFQISKQIVEKEMVQFLVPPKVYANVSFVLECRVSVFLFAYGTILTDEISPERGEKLSLEYYNPYGYRTVNRTITFTSGNETKILSCFAPLLKSEGWVSKTATVFVEYAIPPIIDNSTHNLTEVQTVSVGTTSVIAECNASGNPNPSLRWIFPPTAFSLTERLKLVYDNHFIRIIFPEWEQTFFGTYVCEAKNSIGLTTKAITFQPVPTTTNVVLIITSSLGAFTFFLGCVIGILIWKIRKQRLDFEKQTQKAIEEFRNGLQIENAAVAESQDPNHTILQLPYNEGFEIPLSKWDLEEKVLGSGQFGIVKMGSVLVKGERIKVAVKTLKSSVEIDEFKSFLFELKIMAYLGHHKNVVSLVAACTEGISERSILIGVEFCENGCLLDFLRKYRISFQNWVSENGQFTSDTSRIINEGKYVNISMISTNDLYRWAYHIACGMDYLRIRNVLHGDLAARNVLLTSRKVAKVGDFGLSRVLANSQNYTKKSETALPWKWMAIESLQSRVFSTATDMWSYGICLYEIFSLGHSPYPGIGWSPEFITHLENGMRMERPVYCTTTVYKIMRACWEHDPHLRPSYMKIKGKLSKGMKKLKSLLIAHNQSVQNRTPNSISEPPELIEAIESESEAAQTYTNVPKRTMNYYKNC